jgi:hypothetical protein
MAVPHFVLGKKPCCPKPERSGLILGSIGLLVFWKAAEKMKRIPGIAGHLPPISNAQEESDEQ